MADIDSLKVRRTTLEQTISIREREGVGSVSGFGRSQSYINLADLQAQLDDINEQIQIIERVELGLHPYIQSTGVEYR